MPDYMNFDLQPDELEKAKIPKRFWNLSKDDYYGKKTALVAVEKYIRNNKKVWSMGTSLVFTGAENSGKTFLCTYVLRAMMGLGYNVRYITMSELTEIMMRPEPGKTFRSEISLNGFVALDNITEVNAGTQSAFRRFIEHRRDDALPTLVTVGSEDLNFFTSSYEPDARKLLDISLEIRCYVDPFKTEKMNQKIKSAGQ